MPSTETRIDVKEKPGTMVLAGDVRSACSEYYRLTKDTRECEKRLHKEVSKIESVRKLEAHLLKTEKLAKTAQADIEKARNSPGMKDTLQSIQSAKAAELEFQKKVETAVVEAQGDMKHYRGSDKTHRMKQVAQALFAIQSSHVDIRDDARTALQMLQ